MKLTLGENFDNNDFLIISVVVLISMTPPIILLLELLLGKSHFGDFSAYYDAAYRFLNGYPIYSQEIGSEIVDLNLKKDMPYLYSPITIFVFIPFVILPFNYAILAWNLSSFCILSFSTLYLMKQLKLEPGKKGKYAVIWMVLSFGPTLIWIRQGQVSGLLAAMLSFGGGLVFTYDTKIIKSKLSILLVVLTVFFKPFYAPVGAYLLRDNKRLFWAIFLGFALTGGTVLIFSHSTLISYIDILMEGKGWGTHTRPKNWHSGEFNPLFIFGAFGNVIRVIIVLGVIVISLTSRKFRSVYLDTNIYQLGIITIVLVGPSVNTVTLTVLIPVIILSINREFRLPNGKVSIPFLSLLLIHTHPFFVAGYAKYLPQIFEPLKSFMPILPYLQPAMWGVLILFIFTIFRITENWGFPKTDNLIFKTNQ